MIIDFRTRASEPSECPETRLTYLEWRLRVEEKRNEELTIELENARQANKALVAARKQWWQIWK